MKDILKKGRCRVCGNALFKEPLLRYGNMPMAAQYLPDSEHLKDDKGVDLEIYGCSGCGLVQLNGEPVPYYKEVIRSSAYSTEMKEFRLEQFKDFIGKYSLKNKKIIEIGCGRGEYLSAIEQSGGDAYGLEYSEDSANQGVKSGLNVLKGFVENEDYKIKNAPFDAFCTFNFLEHLPDPNAVLRGICDNLADGAVGLVEVPNFDMILKNNLFSEFMTDHLSYFSKETLKMVLEMNGFRIISCDEIWHDYIISAIVAKKGKIDVSFFSESQKKIGGEIGDYVGRFENVAVWGAGHQAFAVMSLFGLGGKIKYIVDSAPFKQGKYSPVSHTPIISPQEFFSDPTDAVIIMAGSYSDEVAEIVRKKSDKKTEIAILRDFGLEHG